jgi:hypothetical protein
MLARGFKWQQQLLALTFGFHFGAADPRLSSEEHFRIPTTVLAYRSSFALIFLNLTGTRFNVRLQDG